MRDLGYEQGVLRSVGLTKGQSRRLFFYEAFCITITAFMTGVGVGLFANLLVAATFSQICELPLTFIVPWDMVIFIIIVIAITTYIAVLIPAM